MALDGMLIHGIVSGLEQVNGSRISKIFNLSEEEILFQLHGRNGQLRLIINTHSNTNRILLSKKTKILAADPTNFVMVLRKWISQGTIRNIEQIGVDRIVKITIDGTNEIGDQAVFALYAELMGKYANLILVDESTGKIIDLLKRIPVYENSKRLLHPGAIYDAPDQSDRQNPFAPSVSVDPSKSLVSQFQGFSPLLSREFLYRIQNGQSFGDIIKEFDASDTLHIYGKNFHLIELKHLDEKGETKPLMEGLESIYSQDEDRIRLKERCSDVIRCVERELKRSRKKLPRLEEALEEASSYEKYQEYGDLLFAYLYEIQKAPVIELPSFEDGSMVSIELDMRYGIKDNANLFYKKYHKLKRSREILEEQIEQTKDDIAYFELLQNQLEFSSVEDAMEIREELLRKKILQEKKKSSRKKAPKSLHLLHLHLDMNPPADIYVGKNNLQNQFITHKLSNKNDLWFHVKDYHGSHVLLKYEEEPTETLIRLCSNLAAWFSQSRHSSSVPVDYTPVHQLKKVPKAALGFVTMKSYKTIYIDPEEDWIQEQIQKYSVRN